MLEKEGYGADMKIAKGIINERKTALTLNSKKEATITKSINMETPSEETTEKLK